MQEPELEPDTEPGPEPEPEDAAAERLQPAADGVDAPMDADDAAVSVAVQDLTFSEADNLVQRQASAAADTTEGVAAEGADDHRDRAFGKLTHSAATFMSGSLSWVCAASGKSDLP